MGFFSKQKEVEQKLDRMNSAMADSFTRVKQDTGTIFDWIQKFNAYAHNLHAHSLTLHKALDEQRTAVNVQQKVVDDQRRLIVEQRQELDAHKRELNELRLMLMHVPKSREEIKQLIDAHYGFDLVKDRVKSVEERLADFVKERQEAVSKREKEAEKVREAPVRHVAVVPSVAQSRPSVASLREKIIKKLTKNSKDYVKNVVLSLITKYGKISGTQLREMVVEEQGLCSKSSFYRMLDEIRREEDLGVIAEGKEKVFVAKMLKSKR